MSIYGSGLVGFDADDHAEGCAVWVPCTPAEAQESGRAMVAGGGKAWLFDDTQRCTCGCGPLRYQGSHILPSDGAERAGFVSMCTIAGWIDRSPDRPALSDDLHPYWPWLRLMVGDRVSDVDPVTVVLDRRQVEQMRDRLSYWLDHCRGAAETESREAS